MGIPVISSDAASLPEVLGNAAYYFENRNLKDLKKQIVTVMSLPKEKMELTKKAGVEQAQLFNWKNEALKMKSRKMTTVAERINGKHFVETMSVEFLEFLTDCYRVVYY